MSKKRGKLSTEDEQFIKHNINKMGAHEIAVELNRNIAPILKYVDSHNLVHSNMTDDEAKRQIIRKKLHTKPYWAEVLAQFTDREIDYFQQNWIEMVMQFRENIWYSEELELKQMLTLEILLDRSMRDRKHHQSNLERLHQAHHIELNRSMEIRDDVLLNNLDRQISETMAAIGAHAREHTQLLDKLDKIKKSLKATRDQRVANIDNIKRSFQGWVHALQEEEIRERIGDEMELFRLAKENAKTKFSKPHVYVDNTEDLPILTPEIVLEHIARESGNFIL